MAYTQAGLELTRSDQEIRSRFVTLATRRDVADLLEVTYGHLTAILYGPEKYRIYSKFDIAKRSGGPRQISAPPTGLKILQSKLNHVFQLVYPQKKSAHGFIRQRSIVSNAQRHVNKRWVLNIDLADFFPSINFGRVRGMLETTPYSLPREVANTLAAICCDANSPNRPLPQGSPSSPMVSNMLCAKLDAKLETLARKHACRYTRYADDITFSSDEIAFPTQLAVRNGGWVGADITVGTELRSIIEDNGFALNDRKQRLHGDTGRQEVTGLVVNKKVNVRRRFIRQVRSMLYACETFGFELAEQEYHNKYNDRSRFPSSERPSIKRVIRGKLDFIAMVRGCDDPLYVRLANRLHALDSGAIAWRPIPFIGAQSDCWSHWLRQYADLVYLLEAENATGEKATGTAFAWRSGVLATVAHNTLTDPKDGESPQLRKFTVAPPLDETPVLGSEVSYHPQQYPQVDTALIKVAGAASKVTKWFPICDEPLVQGERIAVLGYSVMPYKQAAFALINGEVRSTALDYSGLVTSFQMTIEATPGLSGSPVIDSKGHLVGIVVGNSGDQAKGEPRHNHALPVRYLLEIDLST
jgi:RNA-directed DNA polymerase